MPFHHVELSQASGIGLYPNCEKDRGIETLEVLEPIQEVTVVFGESLRRLAPSVRLDKPVTQQSYIPQRSGQALAPNRSVTPMASPSSTESSGICADDGEWFRELAIEDRRPGRQRASVMAELADPACPMMRGGASFHRDKSSRQVITWARDSFLRK